MKPPTDKNYSLFIRGISITINMAGILFYLTLSIVSILDYGEDLKHISPDFPLKGLWIFLTMWGLAPLIVTTYFLWYLKKANENIIGIFIVTPVAILIHYFTIGAAAHASFLGNNTDVIFIIAELSLAIGTVVLLIRRGHVRH